jgi:hypothetical protein
MPVVGDKTVSPVNQIKGTLGLADPGVTGDEQTDPEHVDQLAVDEVLRCQAVIDER